MQVKLSTISDVQEFVRITESNDVRGLICSGRYRINPQSLMGILTLDLSKPLELVLDSDNRANVKKLLEKFEV